eukprot:gene31734-6934_t
MQRSIRSCQFPQENCIEAPNAGGGSGKVAATQYVTKRRALGDVSNQLDECVVVIKVPGLQAGGSNKPGVENGKRSWHCMEQKQIGEPAHGPALVPSSAPGPPTTTAPGPPTTSAPGPPTTSALAPIDALVARSTRCQTRRASEGITGTTAACEEMHIPRLAESTRPQTRRASAGTATTAPLAAMHVAPLGRGTRPHTKRASAGTATTAPLAAMHVAPLGRGTRPHTRRASAGTATTAPLAAMHVAPLGRGARLQTRRASAGTATTAPLAAIHIAPLGRGTRPQTRRASAGTATVTAPLEAMHVAPLGRGTRPQTRRTSEGIATTAACDTIHIESLASSTCPQTRRASAGTVAKGAVPVPCSPVARITRLRASACVSGTTAALDTEPAPRDAIPPAIAAVPGPSSASAHGAVPVPCEPAPVPKPLSHVARITRLQARRESAGAPGTLAALDTAPRPRDAVPPAVAAAPAPSCAPASAPASCVPVARNTRLQQRQVSESIAVLALPAALPAPSSAPTFRALVARNSRLQAKGASESAACTAGPSAPVLALAAHARVARKTRPLKRRASEGKSVLPPIDPVPAPSSAPAKAREPFVPVARNTRLQKRRLSEGIVDLTLPAAVPAPSSAPAQAREPFVPVARNTRLQKRRLSEGIVILTLPAAVPAPSSAPAQALEPYAPVARNTRLQTRRASELTAAPDLLDSMPAPVDSVCPPADPAPSLEDTVTASLGPHPAPAPTCAPAQPKSLPKNLPLPMHLPPCNYPHLHLILPHYAKVPEPSARVTRNARSQATRAAEAKSGLLGWAIAFVVTHRSEELQDSEKTYRAYGTALGMLQAAGHAKDLYVPVEPEAPARDWRPPQGHRRLYSERIASEPLPKKNHNDLLTATGHLDDILDSHESLETESMVDPMYMDRYDLSKCRGLLAQWMTSCRDLFKLSPETIFIAVNLMDRYCATCDEAVGKLKVHLRQYLSTTAVHLMDRYWATCNEALGKLQLHLTIAVHLMERHLATCDEAPGILQAHLVGVTAMMIATKYEEVSTRVSAKEWCSTTDAEPDQITPQGLLNMEKEMLNVLGYKLSLPTALTFQASLVDANGPLAPYVTRWTREQCVQVLERSLQERRMLQYKPSLLSAAAVLLTMLRTGVMYDFRIDLRLTYDPWVINYPDLKIDALSWLPAFELHSGYRVGELVQCVMTLALMLYQDKLWDCPAWDPLPFPEVNIGTRETIRTLMHAVMILWEGLGPDDDAEGYGNVFSEEDTEEDTEEDEDEEEEDTEANWLISIPRHVLREQAAQNGSDGQ